MAFTDRAPAEKVIAGVLFAVALGWGIRFLLAGGVVEYFRPDKKIENEIQAVMSATPGGEVVLRRLASDFPKKHTELLSTLRERAKADGNGERLGLTSSTWLRQFFAGHENDFRYAPMPYLDAVFQAEEAIMTHLRQTDIVACDRYSVGLPYDGEPSPQFQELAGASIEARFDAIRAGRRDQQLRLELTPRDLDALSQDLLEQGADIEQMEFLSGELNGAVLEEGKPCEAIEMLLALIAKQPDERRALLIGALASQD